MSAILLLFTSVFLLIKDQTNLIFSLTGEMMKNVGSVGRNRNNNIMDFRKKFLKL